MALQLQRCAGISAAEARLACYDALTQRSKDSASSAASSAPPSSATPPVAHLPTPAAAPAAPDAIAAAVSDPKNFGLTLAQQHLAAAGPQSITARIDSTGSGQNGQISVLLDNGQTWTVVSDSDNWISAGETVTIKRAALGSFTMLTSSHHSYKVRRLR
jgi:hypothetical protein